MAVRSAISEYEHDQLARTLNSEDVTTRGYLGTSAWTKQGNHQLLSSFVMANVYIHGQVQSYSHLFSFYPIVSPGIERSGRNHSAMIAQ